MLYSAPKQPRRAQTSTTKRKQAQDVFLGGVGGYPTNHLKAMTTNDPMFNLKLISSSKGSTIRTNLKRKEPKQVDRRRLNQKRTEIRTANKPTHLPPSHHDAKHPNCQKKAVGPRMIDKTSFVSSKQSKTRRTKRRTRQNSTKLNETR